MAGVPIFALEERIFLRSSRLLKRGIDLIVGAIAFVVSAPLFIVVSALIRLESPRPILYAQTRIGKGARPFRCFTFRSMYRAMIQGGQRSGDLFGSLALMSCHN